MFYLCSIYDALLFFFLNLLFEIPPSSALMPQQHASTAYACFFFCLSVSVYLVSCLKTPKRRRVLKKLKGRRILELQPMGQTLQLLAKLLTDDSHKVVISVTSCLCRASGYKSFRLKVWSNPQQCIFQRINIPLYFKLKIQTCCIWANYADFNRPWFTIHGCWMTMTFKCSSKLAWHWNA